MSETETAASVKNKNHLLGQSPGIKRIRDLIEKVADSDSTLLLQGESGTGKEVVAKAIHYQSSRSNKAFIPINCGAIPETLLESELFGHEKGAFTGAAITRQGRFELAHGGTLFFDEISEMPYSLQVKLLRAIQEREFERIGGSKSIQVDVRIIAATNVDLEQAVLEKKFRKDLFYRLNVIPVLLPSLRERKEDIPHFISHFIDQFNRKKQKALTGISQEAADILVDYPWPGNVRELENMIERMVILAQGDTLTREDLPPKILEARRPNTNAASGVVPLNELALQQESFNPMKAALPAGIAFFSSPTTTVTTDIATPPAGGPPVATPFPFSGVEISDEGVYFTQLVEAFEDRLIQEALRKANGVKNRAAQLLHLNRTTLVEKLKRRRRETASPPATSEGQPDGQPRGQPHGQTEGQPLQELKEPLLPQPSL
jgi:transcriptional regulator with PAS, ATPase and Fis domain